MNFKILAIIPARGGSKGIKDKNIYPINGHPLIKYTIDHCKISKFINKIVVSTDSVKIANISKKLGAECPFMRPSEISGDDAVDYTCIRHCVDWLKSNENYEPDYVVHMRCTTPIRNVELLDEAILKIIKNPKADSLRSISLVPYTPYKLWEKRHEWIIPVLKHKKIKESYNQPRQMLPKAYKHDGFVDIIKIETILRQNSLVGKKVIGFEIPNNSIDIDNISDIVLAERALNDV